ncbi:hypothetical protein SAY86_020747 [Trapa natans]|uniref:Mono-/di-acylglycerol lipase N-terminal domain-containing protein n=1 Tax=Trapa natans TaxID=22666 RepID=A0AAN7MRA2_TRANT|nr:hypothetical protein SAY86_020747 [Trapa natans]
MGLKALHLRGLRLQLLLASLAIPDEFEPVPLICRLILAIYEPDLRRPQFSRAGGYRLNPAWLVKRVSYQRTQGHAPPYIIYLDHDHREIALAIGK